MLLDYCRQVNSLPASSASSPHQCSHYDDVSDKHFFQWLFEIQERNKLVRRLPIATNFLAFIDRGLAPYLFGSALITFLLSDRWKAFIAHQGRLVERD